jgi:RimJ/RimL family protein N-acetyltransferase
VQEITLSVLSPYLRAEFSLQEPAGLRCVGVLEGILPGRIFVDDPIRQTRALLQETTFGTFYLAGEWEPEAVADIITMLRQQSEVMLGLWPDDPRQSLIPQETDYTGFVHDFYDHPPAPELDHLTNTIPANCELRRLDASLFDQLMERNDLLKTYGSTENALNTILGYCLLYDGQNMCEALTGPAIHGIREIGINTHKEYHRRGYATLTAAALIQDCDRQGYQTFWNCNGGNIPSLALARRLGYQRERKYTLFYWEQSKST